MSKIIFAFAVLVSVLSGCGTTNPGMQAVQQGAGVAGGAALGWYGSKALGANRPVAMVAAVAGGTLGAVVVSGVQCSARGDCPTDGQQQGHGLFGGGGCYSTDSCDAMGYTFLRPGMCKDPRSEGGQISCQYLVDNPCYRYSGPDQNRCLGMLRSGTLAQPGRNQSKPIAKQDGATSEGSLYGGLTVENYKQSDIIDPECKTGNYGRDARCLKDQSDKLAGYQKACEETGKDCSSTFNYGKASRSVGGLAGLLLREQMK